MDNKKKNIAVLIVGLVITQVCFLLVQFCVNNTIPLLFDFYENVTYFGSKLWLTPLVVLPEFAAVFYSLSQKSSTRYLFLSLFVLFTYENVMVLICLLAGTNFDVGQKMEIPLTCFIFIPLALFVLISGIKLRNLPYKSKLGVPFRCARETEFIWKQSHFFAGRVVSVTGLLLLIISIVMSFFHFFVITLAVFVVAIVANLIVVYCYTHSIYKKYISLKQKSDALAQKTAEPSK